MKHYFHRILSPFWGKIIVTFLIVIMNIGICRAQYAGLKIHYLGANHSLVQVQELQKYLLLPVEEAAPEATVNVLVNNKADQSFQVRLAVNRIEVRLWLWTCIPVTVARMCAMLWTMPAGTT